MSNWIKGTFRARGSKENIEQFLMEGLKPVTLFGEEQKVTKKIESWDDSSFTISYFIETDENQKKKYTEYLHLQDTSRQFITLNSFGEIDVHENNDNFVFAADFKGAWAIDEDAIVGLAKRYEIDIRVNGYECGMEFEQLLEVRKGTITCQSTIQYLDYIWECPMPLLGG